MKYGVIFNGMWAEGPRGANHGAYDTRRDAENRAGEWMDYLLSTPSALSHQQGSVWDNLPSYEHTTPRVVPWVPVEKRPIWCIRCRKFIPRKRWSAHFERKHGGCPHCHSPRLKKIPGDTYDRDGIREAVRCLRCGTESKSFAHGLQEKDRSEYVGELPKRLRVAETLEFHRRATARGYVLGTLSKMEAQGITLADLHAADPQLAADLRAIDRKYRRKA